MGDHKSGKTSLLTRIKDDSFSDKYIPTLNVDFICETARINNQLLTLQLWELTGDPRFEVRSVYGYSVNTAVKGALIWLLVVDLSRSSTLDWAIDRMKYPPCEIHPELTIVMVGTKWDMQLDDDLNVVGELSLRAKSYCSDNGITYFECSSKTSPTCVFRSINRTVFEMAGNHLELQEGK